MRPLTADLFATVDGYAAGEGAAAFFGCAGPDLDRWIHDELAKPQVLIMGRVTYQALAGISAAATDPNSARMRELPKVVFSATLAEPLSWANTRLMNTPATQAVAALRQAPGDPLRVIGSLSLVASLLQRGLVDRLRIVVFPKILGQTGREPILRDLPDIDVDLAATSVLDGRLVVLEYAPKPPQGS